MAEQAPPARAGQASTENVPGVTEDILRAVTALEDQLEQLLGPRRFRSSAMSTQ